MKNPATHYFLFIHAPEREKTFFLLVQGEKVIARVKPKFPHGRTADLLKHIHTMLEKKNVKLKDVRGIVVLSGPGHFSFLRSGLVIANTFAWAQGVPVIGVYGGEDMIEEKFVEEGLKKIAKAGNKFVPVIPMYGKEPNITQPKKKI